MKKITNVVCICLFIFRPNFSLSQQFPDGPYLGQKPPGKEPTIFGLGSICLEDRRESRVVFSPDQKECIICISAHTLLYSQQVNRKWSKLDTAYFIENGKGGEPFFSPDGNYFFFERDADIWMCKKTNNIWEKPIKLNSPINSDAWEWHPSVSLDGTLYFCSNRDRRERKKFRYEMFKSEFIDGQYLTVEKLDTTINTDYGAWDPFIAPDQSYILFGSYRPNGYGKVDHFISYKNIDGSWGGPKILSPIINTDAIEYSPYISPDGKYFFFSRPEGWEPDKASDIYWVDSEIIFTNKK